MPVYHNSKSLIITNLRSEIRSLIAFSLFFIQFIVFAKIKSNENVRRVEESSYDVIVGTTSFAEVPGLKQTDAHRMTLEVSDQSDVRRGINGPQYVQHARNCFAYNQRLQSETFNQPVSHRTQTQPYKRQHIQMTLPSIHPSLSNDSPIAMSSGGSRVELGPGNCSHQISALLPQVTIVDDLYFCSSVISYFQQFSITQFNGGAIW